MKQQKRYSTASLPADKGTQAGSSP